MNGGDSQPVACFELADVDLDLSDSAFGAEIDNGPWRIYKVALTGDLDLGVIDNVSLEDTNDVGRRASYVCDAPDDGEYPTWREVRRALRQWALPVYEASTAAGAPAADRIFDVTIFTIDLEAFNAVCAEAPGLTIDTIAIPVATPEPASVPVPESIDPDAPIAVYESDPEAPANEGLMIGTLQIEDDCVYVQPEGGGDLSLIHI